MSAATNSLDAEIEQLRTENERLTKRLHDLDKTLGFSLLKSGIVIDGRGDSAFDLLKQLIEELQQYRKAGKDAARDTNIPHSGAETFRVLARRLRNAWVICKIYKDEMGRTKKENDSLRLERDELRSRVDSMLRPLNNIPADDLDTVLSYVMEVVEDEAEIIRYPNRVDDEDTDHESADELLGSWQRLFERVGLWLTEVKQQQKG